MDAPRAARMRNKVGLEVWMTCSSFELSKLDTRIQLLATSVKVSIPKTFLSIAVDRVVFNCDLAGIFLWLSVGWSVESASAAAELPRALLHHTIHPRPLVRPSGRRDHSPPTASRGQRGLGCQNYAGDLNALPLRVPSVQ